MADRDRDAELQAAADMLDRTLRLADEFDRRCRERDAHARVCAEQILHGEADLAVESADRYREACVEIRALAEEMGLITPRRPR